MIEVQIGDSRRLIHGLKDKSIDCVVTSPPYWGLRDYKTEPIIFDGLPECEHEWVEHRSGLIHENRNNCEGTQEEVLEQTGTVYIKKYDDKTASFCSLCGAWRGQLGLEPSPELFIKHLLDFFDDVKLKLKDGGNCFVNLGDSYWGGKGKSGSRDSEYQNDRHENGESLNAFYQQMGGKGQTRPQDGKHQFIQPKSLCMIPQRFAWGMIERGWILRNEIIWAKPNHMPESVTDRLTKAHEVIYHFVKQGKYYYNLDAIREPQAKDRPRKINDTIYKYNTNIFNPSDIRPRASDCGTNENGKNPGDVWTITTQPYPESHFAVFPLELVRRPILAGCPIGGTVLDPFAGSGTVGEFCRNNERNAILFELNPDYKKLIEDRAMLLVPELSSWCSTTEDA